MKSDPDRNRIFRSKSEADTEAFGRGLGKSIRGGLCVSVIGPLGAGKTVLVRGICEGLDVEDDVLSPTFILCEEFSGRLTVLHLDLYRLEHEKEIEELGVFDRIGSDCVILAEWGDRSDYLLGRSDLVIKIEVGDDCIRDIETIWTKRKWPGAAL